MAIEIKVLGSKDAVGQLGWSIPCHQYLALGSNERPALRGKCNAIEDKAH
jgi:hypothetical protein